MLQHVLPRCAMMHHVAPRCATLRHVALRCHRIPRVFEQAGEKLERTSNRPVGLVVYVVALCMAKQAALAYDCRGGPSS